MVGFRIYGELTGNGEHAFRVVFDDYQGMIDFLNESYRDQYTILEPRGKHPTAMPVGRSTGHCTIVMKSDVAMLFKLAHL